MDSNKARATVLGLSVVIIAAGTIADVFTGRAKAFDSVPRRMVATTIVAGLLMVLAGFAPRLATGFAWLIGIGYLFVSPEGLYVLRKLGGIGSTPFTGYGGGSGFGEGSSGGSTWSEPIPPQVNRGEQYRAI